MRKRICRWTHGRVIFCPPSGGKKGNTGHKNSQSCLVARAQTVVCFKTPCVQLEKSNDLETPTRMFTLDFSDGSNFSTLVAASKYARSTTEVNTTQLKVETFNQV
ncbi:unnamed protein product [Pylaiella littoralis]